MQASDFDRGQLCFRRELCSLSAHDGASRPDWHGARAGALPAAARDASQHSASGTTSCDARGWGAGTHILGRSRDGESG